NMEKIFDPFQQGDKQTGDTIEGTGIGLSVSKQLVELHGSKLNITSKLHHGSTFSFALPIADEDDEPAEEIENVVHIPPRAEEITLTKPKNLAKQEKKRILIVDDEVVNLQVLMNHLSLENFDVTTTTDSESV